MKPTHCLVAVMVIATPVQNAQVDCADWGTLAFFKAAEVSDCDVGGFAGSLCDPERY